MQCLHEADTESYANHFHFHDRKNIERLEKADLTESDEDDDDDGDDLEVIEFQAKKLADCFISNNTTRDGGGTAL